MGFLYPNYFPLIVSNSQLSYNFRAFVSGMAFATPLLVSTDTVNRCL
jgi:hypothetical protein